MRLLLVFACLLAALAVNPFETALANAGMTTVTLARSDTRTFSSSSRVRFTLAGVHWQGGGSVQLRTRSVGGSWSAWRPAAPEAEDGPDKGSREAGSDGWRIGSPWWTGPSNAIEARVSGRVERVRAQLVWSPESRVPYRMPAATDTPAIVPRLAWNADESIRRGPPSYASDVRFAIVHHTAGRNDYTRAEAAAIVRGIQLFHVQGNGWNDIGYNFLVDRFGTVYEGRFGGTDRNVVGAHARGFNTGSVGIALLGSYSNATPSVAAQDAIARVIAWRLDLAHVDPASFLTFISGGSERYAGGIPVLLRAVSGHRDTGFTECPGDRLYSGLNSIAGAARALGGLKVFEPLAERSGSLVRVRAKLSAPQPWTVAITNSARVEVARGAGAGSLVDWTWDSAGTPAGNYTWTIASGDARPGGGVVRAGGGALPLAIETATAEPEAISPNGDAQSDSAVVTYRVSAAANVSVEVTDAVGGVVATVVDRVWTSAGEHTVTLDGAPLADGQYNVVITARTATGVSVQKIVPLFVSRTLGLVAVAPATFSPNADGRRDRLAVTFSLTAPASVRLRIERDGRWVATPLAGSFLPGPQRFLWDGVRPSGLLRDGEYRAIVEANDGLTPISFGVPFSSDTAAPRIRILEGNGLRVAVSEPATLQLRVDGRVLRREVRRAGTVRIPNVGVARRARVVAWDAAGNQSSPVVRVRRR